MLDLGPHADFIWAAYGVTLIAVAALVLFIVTDDRRQRRLLADLERQGITRRSASPQASKTPASKAQASKAQASKASVKPRPSELKAPSSRRKS